MSGRGLVMTLNIPLYSNTSVIFVSICQMF